MRITNLTHWTTAQLRAIVLRVLHAELDPEHSKRTRIKVKYRRRDGNLGWCTYGDGRRPQPWITLCLPRTESVDPVQVAKTLAHELAHSRGLRHRDMNTVRYGWLEGWREYYAWAASMPIEAEPPKPKPAPLDIVTRKYDHARTMTARAATKAKRAQTHLKKWTRRLRYFERRIAALRSADLHGEKTTC